MGGNVTGKQERKQAITREKGALIIRKVIRKVIGRNINMPTARRSSVAARMEWELEADYYANEFAPGKLGRTSNSIY